MPLEEKTRHYIKQNLGIDSLAGSLRHVAAPIREQVTEGLNYISSVTFSRFSIPVWDSRFKAQIERALGCSIGQAKRGRPFHKSREGGG